jgi:hypothetical protein
MSKSLSEALSNLADQQAAVRQVEQQFQRFVPKPGGVAINPRPLDLVMLAAMHRSRCLLEAAQMLCVARNTIALDPIVRLQVDTLLRVNAVQYEKDPYAVEIALCSGGNVRNLRTQDEKKMHDIELLDRLTNDDFPWLRDTYKKYCDAVHFSTIHVQQSLRQAFLTPVDFDANQMSQEQFIDECLREAVADLVMVTEPLVVAALAYLQSRKTLVPVALE